MSSTFSSRRSLRSCRRRRRRSSAGEANRRWARSCAGSRPRSARSRHSPRGGEVGRRLAETLDLITFFTAGEKETRAWTLRRGKRALDAAETIHSDIARGFIRCEVVRWDDLVEAGGHAEAARAGKQRLEGKTYVVEDGDVLNIRFNV